MPEPFSLIAIAALIAKSAPTCLAALRGTLLDKGRELAVSKGEEYAAAKGGGLLRRMFHLDEKE